MNQPVVLFIVGNQHGDPANNGFGQFLEGEVSMGGCQFPGFLVRIA